MFEIKTSIGEPSRLLVDCPFSDPRGDYLCLPVEVVLLSIKEAQLRIQITIVRLPRRLKSSVYVLAS